MSVSRSSPSKTSTLSSQFGAESETHTLMVHKDSSSGYGLTLFGYCPVYVQTVKARGAADRAGIKERDIILQVNGRNVTEASHDQVVDFIQGGKYVSLTISRVKNESQGSSSHSATLPHAPSTILSHHTNNNNTSSSLVTAPQPPNSEAVRILTDEKYHTIQLMAEQERRNVDGLRQVLVTLQPESEDSQRKQEELDMAQKRLLKLEDQLNQVKDKVSVPSRRGLQSNSSSYDTPPPLPARNKNMTTPPSSNTTATLPPPSLPPRQVRTLPPLPPPLKSIPSNSSSSSSFKETRNESQPVCKSPTMSNFSDPPDSPRYETPPGTPPPPYALKGFSTIEKSPPGGGTMHFQLTQESILKSPYSLSEHFHSGGEILNMEDDEDEEDELSDHDNTRRSVIGDRTLLDDDKFPDVDGPFNNLRDLLCHHAHLSVFLNFVISISDPAPLLFYLITDSYKQGSLKEMQRWAYEIHSSFLVPGAPLPINKIENNTVNVIDRALQEEFDKEEVLRKLFWKVRFKCRKEIKSQLLVFCEKKNNGLGGIFGHSELELRLCIDNRNKELQVIDNLIIPLLDSLTEDLDNATERSLTIASSLATILSKTFLTRNPTAISLIEKCPTFVSKEKKSNKLFGRNKKSLQVQGHNFELKQYYEVTYCNQSQIMIWGIGPQGYRCSNCGFDVYRKYVQHVEETCVATGPSSRRKTRGGVFSRILSDRDLSAAVHPWKSANQSPNTTKEIIPLSISNNIDDSIDDHNSTIISLSSALTLDQSGVIGGGLEPSRTSAQAKGPCLPPPASGAVCKGGSLHDLRSRDPKGDEARGTLREQSGKKVGRAQSCKLEKEQPKSRASTRERRKHSDPNIPRQTSSDAEAAVLGADGGQSVMSNQPSGSSSTSSLSARSSLDSPAGSLQEMASSSSSHPNSSSVPSSSRANGSGVPPPPPPPLPPSDSSSSQHSQHPPFWDSDFETEPDPPDWRFSMNQDDLVKLRPIEKKKQDVINEFFHTERSHVRNLKVLDRIFYRPMLDNPSLMSVDMVQRLFPNLDELIQIHTKFNQIMKDRIKSQGFPLGDISDILLEMFDGPNGDTLIELGSEFTQNQKFTMEELKKKRGRDHKFDAFLSDLERRPECRRLGLESILPVEHQRLVKYPLLLEQLSKQIPEGPSYSTIKSCVERTKFILDSIDKRVAEAQNLQRLADIQRNLDTSGLEKNPESSIPAEYKNCDLTKHRLIYDGPLTLKLGDTRRYKTVDLHVVLLEDCIMLLQKQDDKYLLKFHTSGAASSTGDKKLFHSPIIEFSTMLVRPVATDKRAFYLLNITQTVPQIYELIASSSADRSQWFRHITEASNAYRARDNRRNFRTTGGISPLPDTGISSSSSASTNGLGSSLDGNSSRKEAATASSLLGVKGILPGGRSHSFHESSSSNRESPPERQPSSPPEDIGTKSEDNSASGAGGSESTTPRKRLQRVEILKIAEPSPLIDPSQVVVTQGEILVADPVLTPIEKLRRKDLEISKALGDKQRIIADIFQIPSDDFDAIADIASQPSENKDAREVLVAALAQANSLSELLNENLNLTEEDTIAASSSSGGHSTSYQANRNLPFFRKAIQKSSNINQLLTSLLAIFQMREEERDRSRHCLQRYQDQIDVYLSDSTSCPVGRPASFISVEEETSSGLHDSEEDEEKRQASLSRNQSESQDLPPTSSVESGSSELHPEYGGGKPMLQEAEEEDIVVVKESNKVVESVVVEAKPEVISSHESDNLISLSPQEYDEEEGLLLLPETAACDVATKTEEEQHHEDEEIHESPKSSSHQATAESAASLEDEEVSKTTTADENPSASKEETSIKDDEPQS